jgi:hypothetical protein
MPLKLNVGIQKKHGLPNYSSVSTACFIELELDQSLLVDDLVAFQNRVQRTYAACREAVETELARQLNGNLTDPAGNGAMAPDGSRGPRPSRSRRGAEHRPASRKQLAYIEKLAGQIPDFNQQQLAAISDHLFGRPPTDLSCLGASTLIAVLQDLQTGRIDIETALSRAA